LQKGSTAEIMTSLSQNSINEYLDRIHVPMKDHSTFLAPSLQTLYDLHEAHLLAVPFENLSIHYGQPITLEEEALFEKIVHQRRGGFCYELNGLFAWLLHQLGFQVTLLSAGVARASGGFGPEFDHLTLLVHELQGADWVADVGFGDSFLRPLRFEAEVEQTDVNGHSYRLLRDELVGTHPFWVVQHWNAEHWEPQYRFTLQPRERADFMEMCHYQQTSPESHFTQHRICTLTTPTGRVTLSDLRVITTVHGQKQERLLTSEEEYQGVLAEVFGIRVKTLRQS
jgi:N-hydroxyarylamine O-acetyltransferase